MMLSQLPRVSFKLLSLLVIISWCHALQLTPPSNEQQQQRRRLQQRPQQQPPQHQKATTMTSRSRRQFFYWTAASVAASGAPNLWILSPPPAAAVMVATGGGTCVSGVGDDCAALAAGNDLIRQLQERSAANKERYEREARNAYYMKNYPDWFQTVGKTLVKRAADGSFVALDADQVAELQNTNKLTLEYPTAMGGRVVDYTQKPILVIRE